MDRNPPNAKDSEGRVLSLSARRAWIEILCNSVISKSCGVALRKESVDRNKYSFVSSVNQTSSLSARRAWIEIQKGQANNKVSQSLSARRAWIEMLADTSEVEAATVALRKESVDRNCGCFGKCRCWVLSLSARRAWIEIQARTLSAL